MSIINSINDMIFLFFNLINYDITLYEDDAFKMGHTSWYLHIFQNKFFNCWSALGFHLLYDDMLIILTKFYSFENYGV